MTTRLLASLCVAAGIAVAAFAGGRPAVDRDRDALAALEQEWLDAEHDRDVLDRILAEDFIHPVPAGVFLTKAQHIDWSAKHPGPADHRQRFDQMRIRTYGDTGIVTGVVVSADGQGHESRTVFTDVFVRQHGRWRAVNAQENAVEPFVAR